MAKITQRISAFRGVNRSARQNSLDISYAYNAENVDIVGGKLTNKIGNYRCVMHTDVPAANPIIHFTNDGDYMILRNKYISLGNANGTHPDGAEFGPYDPFPTGYTAEPTAHVLTDVNNQSGMNIRGIGRSYVRTYHDFVEDQNITPVTKDVIIASGMLDSGANSDYWTYRNFLTDGASANTAFYYLGEWTETVDNQSVTKRGIVCRKFGSGPSMAKNLEIKQVDYNSSEEITKVYISETLSAAEKDRAVTDGIFIFDKQLSNDLTDKDIDSAYFWIKVISIDVEYVQVAGQSVQMTAIYVEPTKYTETVNMSGIQPGQSTIVGDYHLRPTSYVFVRGGCSDKVVTFMQMYYGRLFAAAHRSNTDYPRRLFWSCLPGDGRTIEDWTQTDASIETSGGHVDVGDPSDGYITGLITCGSQLLIFTQTRLWRFYGTSPSNYRLEIVGNLEGSRVSNPIEVGGAVYWMSLAGISYYNGSYIVSTDDNYNTRHILEDMPKSVIDAMYYETIHANLFDNSIMFAVDQLYTGTVNYALVIRYELETGNVLFYKVPCSNFLQQFTWVHSMNYGPIDGSVVNYETRYFQALVHADHTMTMTQWHDWGRQDHGWYDNQAVESLWETDWDDFRAPETAKKVQSVLMRGTGEFDFTIESEASKDKVHVNMPGSRGRVKDITPKYAEGRSMKFAISGNKLFEIEPYMTMLFDNGDKR